MMCIDVCVLHVLIFILTAPMFMDLPYSHLSVFSIFLIGKFSVDIPNSVYFSSSRLQLFDNSSLLIVYLFLGFG